MPGTARQPRPESEAAAEPVIVDKRPAPSQMDFPIVGIGASAGGLEAFSDLLQALPAAPGMALILIQHLDPRHESMLPDILSRATPMPVRQAVHRTRVEPNHVYVIPPNTEMAISQGTLRLQPRRREGAHLPINFFLRSLAEDQGSRAIGVILSGSASDGVEGMRAIKEQGGVTFAQDEDSAKFGSMPRSALASGCVDTVLPPQGIAQELVRIGRHPYTTSPLEPGKMFIAEGNGLKRIFVLLQRSTGVDFGQYKPPAIRRRIAKRMLVHKIEAVEDYAEYLRRNPAEVEALFEDLLITVTSFFRDPDTFETLAKTVFPRLVKDKPAEAPIRVWVPACATGEEVYSLGMRLLEFLGGRNIPLQLFGTDVSGRAIEKARAGEYPRSIEGDVSPERLRRFFVNWKTAYRVSKPLRDLCVFARHDLTRDPPFSNLDLISCRNVLIYLEPAAQQKVVSVFHYALRPAGFLLLGRSEALGRFPELFGATDRKHKIYSKQPLANPPIAELLTAGAEAKLTSADFKVREPSRTDVYKEADQIVLARYGPPGFIIGEKLEILKFLGRAPFYLEPAAGDASLGVMKMLQPGLAAEVRAAIQKARTGNTIVRKKGLSVKHGGKHREVNLEVIPIRGVSAELGRCFLVLFEEIPPAKPPRASGAPVRGIDPEKALQWKRELAAARQHLRTVIEESEVSNEELQSATEELQSRNEELQSTNEELETSKEELQAANEEITTLNETLQSRNEELGKKLEQLQQSYEYSEGIVGTVRHPLVVLEKDLRVRTANRAFYDTFQVSREETERRPFYELEGRQWDLPELRRLLEEILSRQGRFEDFEVEWASEKLGARTLLLSGRRFEVGGDRDKREPLILLAIEDVTERRRAQAAQLRQEWLERVLNVAPVPILLMEISPPRVYFANAAARTVAGGQFPVTGPAENHSQYYCAAADGKPLPEEELPAARVARGERLDGFELKWHTPQGVRSLILFADVLPEMYGQPSTAVLVFQDITRIKHIEAELRRASEAKDTFLATVSHELRTPLTAILGYASLLASGRLDRERQAAALEVIQRNARLQARLIEDLLDFSQMTAGRLRVELDNVELQELVRETVTDLRPSAKTRNIEIDLAIDPRLPVVRGDASRLRQVVNNLVSNAIKFTPEGGRISVELQTAGAQVQLTVSDPGCGIEPEFLPHIFQPFHQAAPAGGPAGLGIGLAIARQVVEMHAGAIHVESRGKGQGSTFVVKLPVAALAEVSAPAASRPAAARPASQERGHSLHGITVLVVDDVADAREILALMLRECGATVRLAGSAAEALSEIQRQEPDVLVSDIAMPEKDGYELLRSVRELGPERGGNVPALALTALASHTDREKALSAGFQMYLPKPVEPLALQRAVAALSGRLARA
jgi:two-component system CheB/CheR fusion protein